MHDEAWIEQNGDGSTNLVALLVHGRGREPEEMQALAASLGLSGARCLFPAATGSTWYPQSFLAPIEANEPSLSAAIGHYERLVGALLTEGVAPERILLGGFSQGACLTAEYLARHPRRYAGAVLFTGGLIGPPGTTWPARRALQGMPVYLTTSQVDEWVPPARVEETATWLDASGAKVSLRIFDARPHLVSEAEIVDAGALVEKAKNG